MGKVSLTTLQSWRCEFLKISVKDSRWYFPWSDGGWFLCLPNKNWKETAVWKPRWLARYIYIFVNDYLCILYTHQNDHWSTDWNDQYPIANSGIILTVSNLVFIYKDLSTASKLLKQNGFHFDDYSLESFNMVTWWTYERIHWIEINPAF